MPYTKEELNKNEYYQKLKEADRESYLIKLNNARSLDSGAVVVTEDGNQVITPKTEPLRNEAGTFLLYEDPFDDGRNLQDLDQQLEISLKSPLYNTAPLWDNIIDREIKEL